jgi:quercetin dioxygenase-like cupin family protein
MKTAIYVLLISLALTGCVREKQPDVITVEKLASTNSSWDGTRLPSYPAGIPEIAVLRFIIPPNFELPIHKHPVINAGVLLKGSLTVITEDKEVLHLKAGDSIVETVGKWHHGKNEGDTAAEIIVFYAGIENTPITIKK